MDNARQFVTGVACKAVGGKWRGGHDISGHVFLLVLGSMFLFEEVLHVVLDSAKTKEERTIFMNDGAIKSADVERESASGTTAGGWSLGAKVVMGVGGLSLYMLLMTAAYFHTWFEKVCQTIRKVIFMLIRDSVDGADSSSQRDLCCIFPASSGTKR